MQALKGLDHVYTVQCSSATELSEHSFFQPLNSYKCIGSVVKYIKNIYIPYKYNYLVYAGLDGFLRLFMIMSIAAE